MKKIPLKPEPLQRADTGFYVKQEDGGDHFWLGYIHEDTGDRHESRISEELYKAFAKEAINNIVRYQIKPQS